MNLYMQTHQIARLPKQKSKKRVGRGGKRGTFSGHGVKGQKARAGRKLRPAWRDLVKQIPKRRGYRFKSGTPRPVVLNFGILNNFYKEDEIVSPISLIEKGIVDKIKGKAPKVKILGDGELNKKLSFTGLTMSDNAKEKIKKAGGSIK